MKPGHKKKMRGLPLKLVFFSNFCVSNIELDDGFISEK